MESYKEKQERICTQQRIRDLELRVFQAERLLSETSKNLYKYNREEEKHIENLYMKLEVIITFLSQNTEFYAEKMNLVFEELNK